MTNVGNGSAGTASLDKGLQLLASVIRDDGRTSSPVLAQQLGIPGSTARRMLLMLERQGLIARFEKGRYAAGGQFIALSRSVDAHAALARSARPLLRRLANGYGMTVHLGVLEDGMVTYLIKETPATDAIFTREQGQLEAYCTGVGKVLLAHLDRAVRDVFLGGDFIALTPQTITNPAKLRIEIERVRAQGYAVDDREMAENVFCVAVPLLDRNGHAVAALSMSGTPTTIGWDRAPDVAADLQKCALAIANKAGITCRSDG
jgi:IclR family transcriptional regulator, acetate operon repressor